MQDTITPASAQSGWAVWLTGLPASGKTTIARRLQQRLRRHDPGVVLLDSDALRPILDPTPQYDETARSAFYARLLDLVELLVRQGLKVIVAATANRRAYRDLARARLPRFAEVWVKCPLATCRRRDPKGLYARALAGEIGDFPGVNSRYEAPTAAECIINSDACTPDEAVDLLLSRILWLQSG